MVVAPDTASGRFSITAPPLLMINEPKLRFVPEEVMASTPPLSTRSVPVTLQMPEVAMVF